MASVRNKASMTALAARGAPRAPSVAGQPPGPRYLEIQNALMAEIRSGTVAVGGLLPTEHELCQRYGVSRFTVRQALRGLQEAGMIDRRAGIGTIVLSADPRETFVQSLTSLTELLRYPSETYRKEVSRQHIRATAEQAHMLHCSPGEPWVRLRGVRLARGSRLPISWSDIFLRPRFESALDQPNPDGEPVYRQVELHCDHAIQHAHVEIFAGRITPDLSKPMKIAEGTPTLNMIRRYTGTDGEIFLVTYTVHPENRFVFSMDLVRRWEPVRGH